jgi:hypothetical protein
MISMQNNREIPGEERETQTRQTGESFLYDGIVGSDNVQPVLGFEDGIFRTASDYSMVELELPWYGDVPVSITRLNSFFDESNTQTVEGKMENLEDLFDQLYQTNELVERKSLEPQPDFKDWPCFEDHPYDPKEWNEDSDPSTITEKEFREQFRFQSGFSNGKTCIIESDSESEEGFCPDEDFVSAIASSSSSSEEEEIVQVIRAPRIQRPRRIPRSELRKVQEDRDSTLLLTQNLNRKAAWNRTLTQIFTDHRERT